MFFIKVKKHVFYVFYLQINVLTIYASHVASRSRRLRCFDSYAHLKNFMRVPMIDYKQIISITRLSCSSAYSYTFLCSVVCLSLSSVV